MSITDKQLKAIIKNDTYSGASELNDGEGLIARVSPKARITFQYRCRFNGKNQRIKIGKYPIISLKEARQIHKRMLELKEAGRNPEIALTGDTDFVSFDDCVSYWFEHKVNTLKEGTQVLYQSVVDNYFNFLVPTLRVVMRTELEITMTDRYQLVQFHLHNRVRLNIASEQHDHVTSFNRILMDIFNLLTHHLITLYQFRVYSFLPKLISTIILMRFFVKR